MRASNFVGLLIALFGTMLIVIGGRRRVQRFKQAFQGLTK